MNKDNQEPNTLHLAEESDEDSVPSLVDDDEDEYDEDCEITRISEADRRIIARDRYYHTVRILGAMREMMQEQIKESFNDLYGPAGEFMTSHLTGATHNETTDSAK